VRECVRSWHRPDARREAVCQSEEGGERRGAPAVLAVQSDLPRPSCSVRSPVDLRTRA
jgi:hypothetical protein